MNRIIKTLQLLSVICVSNIAFGQNFTISGYIKGLSHTLDSAMLIKNATFKDEKPAYTVPVVNGRFTIKGVVKEPRQFNLKLKSNNGAVQILIDKGNKIQLSADANVVTYGDYSTYKFSNIQITGAPLQRSFEEKMKPRYDLDQQHNDMQLKYAALSKSLASARASKDSVRVNEIEQSVEYGAMNNDSKKFFATADSVIHKIIQDNKNSWWGPLLTLNLYNFFGDNNEKLFDDLGTEVKKTYYAGILKEQVKPEGLIHKQAPNIIAKTEEGKAFQLQELLKDKKVILIDFWASWCVPCRKKIPELKSLYDKYKDKGLEIIGISVDKQEKDWRKALNEEHLPYPNFLAEDTTAKNWKIRFIPMVFILDNTGKVIGENMKIEDIEQLLNK